MWLLWEWVEDMDDEYESRIIYAAASVTGVWKQYRSVGCFCDALNECAADFILNKAFFHPGHILLDLCNIPIGVELTWLGLEKARGYASYLYISEVFAPHGYLHRVWWILTISGVKSSLGFWQSTFRVPSSHSQSDIETSEEAFVVLKSSILKWPKCFPACRRPRSVHPPLKQRLLCPDS